MPWQDLILGSGGAIFAAALLPSLASRHKPAAATSLLTALVLGAYVVCYASMHLRAATATTSIVMILWIILLIQKRRQLRGEKTLQR